jgi:hypothetical protein
MGILPTELKRPELRYVAAQLGVLQGPLATAMVVAA